MTKLSLVLAAFLTFTATLTTHAAPTSTQRFIASLTDELDAKVVGDDELVVLIESAQSGRLANPICEATAELSTERLLAYEGFKNYIDAGDLDAAAIAAWARENLVENARGRARRDESRGDTVVPWKKTPYTIVSTGAYHSCAIDFESNVKCWGGNHMLQSEPPADLGTVVSVSAGGAHTCAIKTDGTVRCWGNVCPGPRDDPTRRLKCEPLQSIEPPADLGVVQSVSAGASHACAIKRDGKLICWGGAEQEEATLPQGLEFAQSVSAGSPFTCAIDAEGRVKCWMGGKLMDQVEDSDAQAVSAGAFMLCVLNRDDTVKCLAGASSSVTSPANLGAVRSVSAGFGEACAIRSDGTVRCWGEGSTLEPPADLGVVESLSLGYSHACVSKLDGTVRCFGEDRDGKLDVPEGLIVKSSRN